MPTDHDQLESNADHLDEIGRRAGAELRRPSPPRGLALVERSLQRRRAAGAVAGGVAVAGLVVAGVVLANRGRGESIVTEEPVTFEASVPNSAPSEAAPPDTTDAPQQTAAPTSDVGRPTTAAPTTAPPPTAPPRSAIVPVTVASTNGGTSEEVLPDPLAIAGDGFERVLVGRDLIVRSEPERVFPLDVPEPGLWLYGVGPNGVAYLRAEGADLVTRILAVPTTGETAGTVYEIVAPYVHEGPWLGFMTPQGIDPFSLAGSQIVPYVDLAGQPLRDAIDASFTWRVEYEFTIDEAQAVVTEMATGASYAVPVTEPAAEGQFAGALRPLPDGRVTLHVLRDDFTYEVWALDPATATWIVHPVE